MYLGVASYVGTELVSQYFYHYYLLPKSIKRGFCWLGCDNIKEGSQSSDVGGCIADAQKKKVPEYPYFAPERDPVGRAICVIKLHHH